MKRTIIITSILFIVTSFIGCAVSNKKEITSAKEPKVEGKKEVAQLKGQGIKEILPTITGTYDDKKWQRCIEFHGHECAGSAMGFRVAEAVIEKLHLTFSKDEKLVCVTENDSCANDSIQVVLGCSFGKGNLIFHNTGKNAFNFFNLKTGEKVRICSKGFGKDKDSGKEPTKEEQRLEKQLREEYVLKASLDELFDFKEPTIQASKVALLSTGRGDRKTAERITCEICGEKTPEYSIRFQDKGKKVCIDCFKEYTRGW